MKNTSFHLLWVTAITFSRFLVGLAVPFLFFSSNRIYVLACILYIFLSDIADGFFARRWGVSTRAGAIFDYVVDRLNFYLQISILIKTGMAIVVFLPFFIRDLIYIFTQSYIQLPRINGTKSMSFLGTATVYLSTIYLSLGGGISKPFELVIFLLLLVSLLNLLHRVHRVRHLIAEKFRAEMN